MLLFRGGGWRAGSKEAVHARAAALARAGVADVAALSPVSSTGTLPVNAPSAAIVLSASAHS